MSFHSNISVDSAFEPPTPSQSQLYCRMLRKMGRDVLRLDLNGVGLGRLILRDLGPLGKIALMPGGPRWRQGLSITARRDVLADLPRLARHHCIRALITNCATPLDERILRISGHLPLVTGGYHAQLDLGGSSKTRRARMQGKWRNRLCHAENHGITVNRARFDPRRHGWLLEAEAKQRQTRGYRGLPLGFVSVAAETAPNQVQLFIASQRGTRLGAMLFLMHEGTATFHIGHLTDTGRGCSAHNLLLWQAATWLARKDTTWIDLGPLETETSAGLARFKLGSGAQPVQRGASCLYSAVTSPLGRLTAGFSRKAARGIAGQTGQSSR
ncbi:GNAT family N-acetyltransferase [Alisedimentitalea sp. MJ-SS2]|uniref:GNAT family N-acetyltransferase n=1 Tax=Aliisedimentitalea sp. MJ-SS2 TaxID=3049795 RepID=UPI0029093124|nr:GNAT family N-acetyltransferase [Alisedimentitalea sp. MJ-SS2]MDU8929788.1 GNAT family N-acetyltransferase [Alisedimentitalea sp. MJ-SS2]